MRSTVRLLALLLALLVFSASSAPVARAQDGSVHFEDLAYLLQVMLAANAQIRINEVAVEKAENEDVRAFAEEALATYKERYETASGIAEGAGYDPITMIDPPTEYQLGVLDELSGPAFDATYIAGQVPAIYAEEWVHRRTERHATLDPVAQTARSLIEPTNQLYERALKLSLDLEENLPDGALHPWDSTVLVFGMNVDIAQVALGEAVAATTEDEAVRAFAQRMVDEHSGSFDNFAALAREHGIEPLEEPGEFEKFLLTYVSGLPEDQFDLAYLQSQVVFHDNWYKRIEFTGHNGRDAAVEAAALAAHEVGMAHHDAVYQLLLAQDD